MVSIQLLRAIAVIMVIIFHVLLKARLLGLTAISFSQGAAGVDLFFIISGFIMAYISTQKEFIPLDFIRKRLQRIIPLYWLLSSIVCMVYFYNPSIVNSHNGETNILSSFSLLPTQGKAMLLEIGWTLRYEFFFYLIFTLSMIISRKDARYCILIIMVISMASLFNVKSFYFNYFTNPIIIEFAIGIFSFYSLPKITKKHGWMALTIGMSLLILFGLYNYGLQNRVVYYGIPMCFIFIGLLSFEKTFKNNKSHVLRLFSYLGDASYSLYLSHTLTIGIMVKIYASLHNLTPPYLFVFLSVTISVIIGGMCYELVEKPINRFVKRIDFSFIPDAANRR
jgi:exopolysaccharide production protein ExoZ